MDMSPQDISTATFRTVKKGYDPQEVRGFLAEVATTVEQSAERATAMEARARAAVVKLQEATQAAQAEHAATSDDGVPTLGPAEAETISRTLLLAQRTADTTVAEANAAADAILADAQQEASELVDTAQAQAARVIDESRVEARRAGEAERMRVEGEVQSLLARRDFLLSDVDHLEEFVAEQRRRLLEVAEVIEDVANRQEGGLGAARRPLLSAAADGSRPAPTAVPEPEAERVAEPEPEPEPEPPATVEAVPDVHPDVQPDVQPDVVAEAAPEVVAAAASEDRADSTPVIASRLPGLEDHPTQEVPVVADAGDGLRFRTDV